MNPVYSRHNSKEFICGVANDKIVVTKLTLQKGRRDTNALFTKDIPPSSPQPSIIQSKYEHGKRIVKLVCVSRKLIEHQMKMIAIGQASGGVDQRAGALFAMAI